MSEQSIYTLAAMASAAMPTLQVAGTRESQQSSQDEARGIYTAVITDIAGRQFDVCMSTSDEGKTLLRNRARAASALSHAKEPASLGFALEQVVGFSDALSEHCATGDASVLIRKHYDGYATALDQLTDSQCASMGTAIGAIHRLRSQFVLQAGYAGYSAQQIHHQLEAWMRQLRNQGQIPTEIIDNWQRVVATDGLWSFKTCLVHGGFQDGDILFSSTGLNAMYHWSDIQVNDPARDLAWMFDKLATHQRNIVLSSYARIVGSYLDELIMLRASLWRQMEEVGAFMQALDRADSHAIMLFKSRVEQLAHQLAVRSRKATDPTMQPMAKPQALQRQSSLASEQRAPQSQRAAAATPAGNAEHARPTATIAHAPVIGERLTDEQHSVPAAGSSSATMVLGSADESHSEHQQSTSLEESHAKETGASTNQTAAHKQHVPNADGQPVDADAPTVALPKAQRAQTQKATDNAVVSDNASTEGTEPTDSTETTAHGIGIERTDRHPTGYVSLINTASEGAAEDATSNASATGDSAAAN